MAQDPAPKTAGSRHGAVRQLLTPVLGILLASATLLLALGGGALWLLRSEAGTVWLLQRLPRIEMQGLRGALLSDNFAFDRLRIQIGLSVRTLEIEGVVAEGVSWSWFPGGSAWFGVHAQRLSARRLAILTGPSSPGKATPPRSLDYLFTARVDQLELAELSIGTMAPIRQIRGRATLGADGGRRHVVEAVSATWDRVQASAQGSIRTRAPFELEISAQGRQAEGSQGGQWQAQATASGSLNAMSLAVQLRGTPRAGRAAPSLDLRAQVLPFADWSLGELQAQTRALDLSALSSAAPVTRLQGSASVQSSSMDSAAAAQVRMDNELPGPWTEGRLPVRRVELVLSAVPRTHERLELSSFDLQLASGSKPAGRVQGRGAWTREELLLDATVQEMRPQLADGRAPAMTLSGPLQLSLRGLPWPGSGAATPAADWGLALRGDLQGQLDVRPQPVRARFDAMLSDRRVELRDVHASTGSARADFSLKAQRRESGAWSIGSQGRLQDFDPLPWWPGEPDSAWRQGTHRASADWGLEMTLPRDAGVQNWLQTAQTTVGSGRLRVHDALLAGVPWKLEVSLSQDPAGGPASSRLHAGMQAAGAQLDLQAQGDPRGPGQGDTQRRRRGYAQVLQRALQQFGDGRFGQEADHQRCQGNADLRTGQLCGQRPQGLLNALSRRVAGFGLLRNRGAVDGDEAELGGHEKAARQHQEHH